MGTTTPKPHGGSLLNLERHLPSLLEHEAGERISVRQISATCFRVNWWRDDTRSLCPSSRIVRSQLVHAEQTPDGVLVYPLE